MSTATTATVWLTRRSACSSWGYVLLSAVLEGATGDRAQGVGAGGASFLLVDDEKKVSIALLSNAIGEKLGPTLQAAVGDLHEIFGGQ